MLYLAFIFHMHQPYYKNLLTQEIEMPWVRLHGTKDYLDMVEILEKYPAIKQTFNLVPSLLEQIEDYTNLALKDKFLELSYKVSSDLTTQEKEFILENFFKINREKVISAHPRYYELYLKRLTKKEFNQQDYLDLQVWFNLAWIDPDFRRNIPELKNIVAKGRFFSEEEKAIVLGKQLDILKDILPTYKRLADNEEIEITLSPYYHPILPLLYNTKIAKDADHKVNLPQIQFSYPQDAEEQINQAINFYRSKFEKNPAGIWPSEESVSEHILPSIIRSGIKWMVADEAILFKSLRKGKREAKFLYQPYLLERKDGNLKIIFRDRHLSDLISFVYHRQDARESVDDFINHLKNISSSCAKQDSLVVIAMDGENAWEYYDNDGHNFLELLYQTLSEANFVKTTTVSEYLNKHPAKNKIKRLAAGSWIYANFDKWIGNPYKNKAWELLTLARKELELLTNSDKQSRVGDKLNLAWKQIYICEGSDWFWWYGEDHDAFDRIFRMHLSNFYSIIGKEIPEYLKKPLTT